MNPRYVLVTGATGKQGCALIHSLLRPRLGASSLDIDYRILALTRNAASESARLLLKAEHEHADHIQLVEGNLDDAKSIRKIFEDAQLEGGIWGVYMVLAYPGLGVASDDEVGQGKVREFSVMMKENAHFNFFSFCRWWQT